MGAVTDWLPVLFVIASAAAAAVALSAVANMRSTTETFARHVKEAQAMLNALIDRLKP